MGRSAAPVTGIVGLVALAALSGGILPPLFAATSADAATAARIDHAGPLRIVTDPDAGLLSVDGRRYEGVIELTPGGRVVNELPLEHYLLGIAEMPSRWPREALKAQAVAARTYAWWSADAGTQPEADLCATTACQVYRGAEVVLDGGQRWAEAVEATAGQVLLDTEGGPALTRYFSTSGGRTYANEDVFPTSGAHPHLVAVEDPYDEVSPYHRWQVRFDRTDFDALLARGERLAATVPVAEVTRHGAVSEHDATIEVTGRDGTSVEVTALELRDFLSRTAPARFPDRYPSARSDGLRPLPSTIPSTRFEVELSDDEVVFHGQGWGHGVGMGQYGARGRAADGHDHRDILAHYYDGLVASTSADIPERIRVALPVEPDDDAPVLIAGDQPLTVTDADGQVVLEGAVGAWRVTWHGDRWRLSPPDGADEPLAVGDTVELPALSRPGDALVVEAAVNRPAELHLEVRDDDGEVVLRRGLGVAEAGTHAATWRLTDEHGEVVDDGRYLVALRARDADGVWLGGALAVTVDDGVASVEEEGSAGRTDGTDDGAGWWQHEWPWSGILAGLVVATLLVAAIRGRRERSKDRP